MKKYIDVRVALAPWCVLGLILLSPALALAHPNGGQIVGAGSGFLSGVWHPLSGLDHICAMVAVGLWAVQRGGKALWVAPLAFVTVMTVGGVLGMISGSLPFVDRGVAASVLVLGLLIASAVRMPLVASVGLIGLFALFHGHAHGAEMPKTAAGLTYALGFIASTVLLHLSGIGAGLALKQVTQLQLLRFTGAAIAVCGAFLLMI